MTKRQLTGRPNQGLTRRSTQGLTRGLTRGLAQRLTSRRTVLVLMLVGASIVLVSGSREWVWGSVADATLGASALQGRGSDVAPGAMATALVGLASAVAAATSGTRLRILAAVAALLASVLAAAVVVLVLVDPGRALGALAASGTGRSGELAANGRVGGWAWVALAGTLVMGVSAFGTLGSVLGGRSWRGLSTRYDAPVVADASRSGPGGGPVLGSAWDQLSRGEDPTAEDPRPEDPRAEDPRAEG